jgi:hypothetical protein
MHIFPVIYYIERSDKVVENIMSPKLSDSNIESVELFIITRTGS